RRVSPSRRDPPAGRGDVDGRACRGMRRVPRVAHPYPGADPGGGRHGRTCPGADVVHVPARAGVADAARAEARRASSCCLRRVPARHGGDGTVRRTSSTLQGAGVLLGRAGRPDPRQPGRSCDRRDRPPGAAGGLPPGHPTPPLPPHPPPHPQATPPVTSNPSTGRAREPLLVFPERKRGAAEPPAPPESVGPGTTAIRIRLPQLFVPPGSRVLVPATTTAGVEVA